MFRLQMFHFFGQIKRCTMKFYEDMYSIFSFESLIFNIAFTMEFLSCWKIVLCGMLDLQGLWPKESEILRDGKTFPSSKVTTVQVIIALLPSIEKVLLINGFRDDFSRGEVSPWLNGLLDSTHAHGMLGRKIVTVILWLIYLFAPLLTTLLDIQRMGS